MFDYHIVARMLISTVNNLMMNLTLVNAFFCHVFFKKRKVFEKLFFSGVLLRTGRANSSLDKYTRCALEAWGSQTDLIPERSFEYFIFYDIEAQTPWKKPPPLSKIVSEKNFPVV